RCDLAVPEAAERGPRHRAAGVQRGGECLQRRNLLRVGCLAESAVLGAGARHRLWTGALDRAGPDAADVVRAGRYAILLLVLGAPPDSSATRTMWPSSWSFLASR